DAAREREIVEAFFRASRAGDFQALLAVLDPDVVLRPDAEALRMGVRTGWLTQPILRGAKAVAEQFSGQAKAAQPALIDGVPGAVWVAGGKLRVAFAITLSGGKVAAIDLIADRERLSHMRIEMLP
ncbi:MAG TPA: RNA polymerase subunit sigma-70, partial [Dehalococcoidia bacterium]|nr:RNA polymerase subunit sigma-70 [Dehalococcoidia bacterium]